MAERLTRVVLATTNKGKLADFRRLFEGTGVTIELPGDHGLSLEVEETGRTFVANALLKARVHARALGLPVLADDSGLTVTALDGRPGVYSARYAGPECDDHANNLQVVSDVRGLEDRSAAFECALALVLPSAGGGAGAGDGAGDGAGVGAGAGDGVGDGVGDGEAVGDGDGEGSGDCEGAGGLVGDGEGAGAGERAVAGEGAGDGGDVADDDEALREGEIVVTGRCHGRIIDEERGTNGFGYDVIFFRDDLGCTFGEATPEQKNELSHRGAAVRGLIEELRSRGLAA